jgi:hypothetical protein
LGHISSEVDFQRYRSNKKFKGSKRKWSIGWEVIGGPKVAQDDSHRVLTFFQVTSFCNRALSVALLLLLFLWE